MTTLKTLEFSSSKVGDQESFAMNLQLPGLSEPPKGTIPPALTLPPRIEVFDPCGKCHKVVDGQACERCGPPPAGRRCQADEECRRWTAPGSLWCSLHELGFPVLHLARGSGRYPE